MRVSGKFLVGRLLAAVGMPQSAVFPSRVSDLNRRVELGPLFHDDFEFWRRFVAQGLASRGGLLGSPMCNMAHRPPVCLCSPMHPKLHSEDTASRRSIFSAGVEPCRAIPIRGL